MFIGLIMFIKFRGWRCEIYDIYAIEGKLLYFFMYQGKFYYKNIHLNFNHGSKYTNKKKTKIRIRTSDGDIRVFFFF